MRVCACARTRVCWGWRTTPWLFPAKGGTGDNLILGRGFFVHRDRPGGPPLLIQGKYNQPFELAGGGNWGRWGDLFPHVYLGSFSLALAQPQFASTDPGRWCLIKSSASKKSGQVWKLCSEWVWTAPLQPLPGVGEELLSDEV